jgi:hypothetical protein
MCVGIRMAGIIVGIAGFAGTLAIGQPPERAAGQRPRPGLTAQQTKQAVELAQGAMQELRKKTEGASEPEADRREYVVNVELLNVKDEDARTEDEPTREKPPTETKSASRKPDNPRAVVTSYRYFDDLTVFSTIDLNTGRVVDVQAAQHIPTPLSDGEYEESIRLARDRSDEVKRLYERFGDQLTVYPQFSQFTVKDDPRRHRVVHLNYRVSKRDLSYPRPQVDLTNREVFVPAPEAEPKAPVRRRSGNNGTGGPR